METGWKPAIGPNHCTLLLHYSETSELFSPHGLIGIIIYHYQSLDGFRKEFVEAGYTPKKSQSLVYFVEHNQALTGEKLPPKILHVWLNGVKARPVWSENSRYFTFDASTTAQIMRMLREGEAVKLKTQDSNHSHKDFTLANINFNVAAAMYQACIEATASK